MAQHNNELETVRDDWGAETSQFLSSSNITQIPLHSGSGRDWLFRIVGRYRKKACYVFLSTSICLVILLSKLLFFTERIVGLTASSFLNKVSCIGIHLKRLRMQQPVELVLQTRVMTLTIDWDLFITIVETSHIDHPLVQFLLVQWYPLLFRLEGTLCVMDIFVYGIIEIGKKVVLTCLL